MSESTATDAKPDVAEIEKTKPANPEPEHLSPVKADLSAKAVVPAEVEPQTDTALAPEGPARPPNKTPRQSDDGEKHDWEVVNASPSHSPSKDRENETAKGKREREKSSNSTFSKDGKIGQKIDGVKKVLKSGVFGGVGSPKSAVGARPGKTITKPPVPSARASLAAAKPAPAGPTRPQAGPSTGPKAPAPAPKPSSTIPKPTAGTTAKSTTTMTSIKSRVAAVSTATKTRPDSPAPPRPAITTVPAKPKIGPRMSSVVKSPTTASHSLAKSKSGAAGPTDPAVKAAAPTTGPQSRRGSVASATSNTSASRGTATKPRTSMPMTAISKSGSKGAMLPPASTTRSMPARASVGPGTFVKKEVEDLKAKIEELEKQVADSKSAADEKVAQADAEKSEMVERHERALDALTVELQTAGDQAKAEADKVLAELREAHKSETDTAHQNHESSRAEMEERIMQLEKTINSLREELAAGQALAKAHQSALEEANEANSSLEEQLAQLRDESETHRQSVIGLQSESVGKDTRIEEMQAKSIELAKTNEQSLQMLDGLRAEIGKMAKELEEVKAVPERDPELDEKLESLEREKASLEEDVQKTKDHLDEMGAEVQSLKAALKDRADTIAGLEQEAAKHHGTLADLESEKADAQARHDGLLLEAAQMSDARIAELSNERDKVTSLRNELVAELEQERASLRKVEAELEDLTQERDVLGSETKQFKQEVEKLQAEMIESKVEHERKYASAFADAQAKAADEHAKDIDILREELTATHTKMLSDHQAELDDLQTAHVKALSDAGAEHQQTVEGLVKKLQLADERIDGAKNQMELMSKSLKEAKEDSQRVKVDLEAALAKSQGDGDSEKELARALRKNAELLDELEGTKTMAEMNKSQFESLRQASEADHSASVKEAADKSAKEMTEERKSHERMVAGLRSEIQRHRQDLERERNEKRGLLEQVQVRFDEDLPEIPELTEKVLQDRVGGARAQHALQGYTTSDQGESGESSSSSEHASPPDVGRRPGRAPSSEESEVERSSIEETRPEMVQLPETPMNEKSIVIPHSPSPAVASAQSSASKLAALDPHPFFSDSSQDQDSDYQSAIAPSGFKESVSQSSLASSITESSLGISEDDKTPNAAMFNVELPDERMLWPPASAAPKTDSAAP